MAVVQDAFYVPDDIMTKLLTGEYKRLGGVIRVAIGPDKGQIVKMLDPVEIQNPEEAAQIGTKILQAIKEHKKGLIITGLVVGAAIVGGVVYYNIKNREPAVVAEFRTALRVYINQIRQGNLELNTIEALMTALANLKAHKNYGQYSVELSTEDLDVLVNRIYQYTLTLAENNSIELDEGECIRSDNSIVNLQNYLKTQKRIFQAAS